MRRSTLAKQLIAARSDKERRRLLKRHQRIADRHLADEIRQICHSSWTSHPVISQRASSVMQELAVLNSDDEIGAIAFWVLGISQITKGKFELAVDALDKASKMLDRLGRDHDSAQTQMAKLLALGMVGRYEDAIEAGEKALGIFIRNRDEVSAGKIEVNLSNVVARNGQHRAAEKYCAAARRRFVKTGQIELQAVAENGLANTYSELNEFEKADRFYRMALETAASADMRVTEAEIEASIGHLARIRGKYGDSLKFLELSRSKYDSLNMPHQSAIADLEIADIYSELNLNTEAADIYDRVAKAFRRLKMRAEEARACLNYGRCSYSAGDLKVAQKQLDRAARLFASEKNDSGQAAAMLAEARLVLTSGNLSRALEVLRNVRPHIRKSENPRDLPAAKLLEGEVHRRAGNFAQAAKKLNETDGYARRLRLPDLEQAAVCALGKLARADRDDLNAEKLFKKAIRLIERLRTPLAAEEFSMGFLASRLDPYDQLANLYLDAGKFAKAFRTIESGRSRTLVDAIVRGSGRRDERSEQIENLRIELNSYYKRIDRADDDEIGDLRKFALKAEAKLADLMRKVASVNSSNAIASGPSHLDLTNLHKLLGGQRTLIEYVEYQGKIAAFIVNGGRVRFVPGLTTRDEVNSLLEDLHFQFGAYRYGTIALEKFRDELCSRANGCLEGLYQLLVEPLERHLSGAALVVIPTGNLHYVPFHALRNASGYLVERFEISYAPSAAVWSLLEERGSGPMKKPLLVGFADERIPLVEKEVGMIKRILPKSACLVGEDASFSAFARLAPTHDLIHLACHGQFRPENPMFSSLHLADGWITVHDICSRSIKAGLVTLSACETGLSSIYAGDEILGLVRGFLSAGANSLIVSLWAVNDAAAGELMTNFYRKLQRTKSIASSIREAQLEFIARGEHPYLWSPFVLVGR